MVCFRFASCSEEDLMRRGGDVMMMDAVAARSGGGEIMKFSRRVDDEIFPTMKCSFWRSDAFRLSTFTFCRTHFDYSRSFTTLQNFHLTRIICLCLHLQKNVLSPVYCPLARPSARERTQTNIAQLLTSHKSTINAVCAMSGVVRCCLPVGPHFPSKSTDDLDEKEHKSHEVHQVPKLKRTTSQDYPLLRTHQGTSKIRRFHQISRGAGTL